MMPLVASASRFRYTGADEGKIITVRGPIAPGSLGLSLTHEHVLVDFIGADKVSPDRYDADEAYGVIISHLQTLEKTGCRSFFECTPNFLGRDVSLLKRLSEGTGLNIVTNTGIYGAAGEKFIPEFVNRETAQQIAARWILEFRKGVGNTGVRPGFIKTGVDKGPLSARQRKLIEAAAITHLQTGLTVGVHTGDGAAAREQLEILAAKGVDASARIWIHAQNETDKLQYVEAAKRGSWVSFDGLDESNVDDYIEKCRWMESNGVLDKVLLSQDAGWYHVGEAGGGNFRDYTTVPERFIPEMLKRGFGETEVELLFVRNPARAFTIGVRRLADEN